MSKRQFDYSSTQINIEGALKEAILTLHKQISKEDLYTEEKGYGLEKEPHVTILYGLHTTNPSGIKKLLKDEKPVKLKLGKITRFSTDDKPYDVLKIDIKSEDLTRLNKLFKDNEEYTSDFDKYHPHLTLAYVKKGKAKNLADNNSLSGRSYIGDTVIFSSSSGKKTPIQLSYISDTKMYKKGFIDRLFDMGVAYEKNLQAKSFLHSRVGQLSEA